MTAIRLPRENVSASGRRFQRTALEAASVADFLDQYYVRVTDADTALHLGAASSVPVPWTHALVELAGTDPTVSLAVQAGSMVLRGQAASDNMLRRAALQSYAAALRGVNRALSSSDPGTVTSDATLAACLALANFERFRGQDPALSGDTGTQAVTPQGHDWLKHINGTSRMIQLRGPAAHRSRHGYLLFLQCRTNAVSAATLMRKPVFYSYPEWLIVPSGDEPGLRDPFDELWDIKVFIPTLLYKSDLASCALKHASGRTSRVHALQQAQDCILDGVRLAERLEDWCERFVIARLDDPSEWLFQESTTYALMTLSDKHGLGCLRTASHYWAACVHVWATIRDLQRSLIMSKLGEAEDADLSTPKLSMSYVPAWIDPVLPARNIANTSARFFTLEGGFWGPSIASYTMNVARRYFESHGMAGSVENLRLQGPIAERVSGVTTFGRAAGEWLRSADVARERDSADAA